MPSSVPSKSSINGISSPSVPSFLKAGPSFWEVLDKSIEKYGRTGGGGGGGELCARLPAVQETMAKAGTVASSVFISKARLRGPW